MASIKLVVFDIAGGIMEDHGDVVRAFAAALEKHGIPFTDSELEEWKGAAKREVIQHFVERQSGSSESQLVEAVYSAAFWNNAINRTSCPLLGRRRVRLASPTRHPDRDYVRF